MRPARVRLAGFLLTLVWMAARLALPLQPTCPHHALDTAVATGVANHHLAELAGHPEGHRTVLPADAAAADVAAAHHGHHGTSTGTSSPGSDASDCECAAHCCAATAIQFVSSAPIAFVALVDAPAVPTPPEARVRPAARDDVAQPPATAPPVLTTA